MNETFLEFFAELAFDYLQFELVIQKNWTSKSRRQAIKVYLQNILYSCFAIPVIVFLSKLDMISFYFEVSFCSNNPFFCVYTGLIYGAKYSRMDQVKFVEDNPEKI